MIFLSVVMCAVTGLALLSARQARVNGWTTRYLFALLVNSLVGMGGLLLWPETSAAYGKLYVAALVPLLAVILVVALGWLWKSKPEDRLFVLSACAVQATLACTSLTYRAGGTWDGIPWQIALFIVQYAVLSSAGIIALASEHFIEESYRPIAHLLGIFWMVQAIEQALFASGFAYRWETWLQLSRWLPQAIVILFMGGLIFKFRAFHFEQAVEKDTEKFFESVT